MVLITLWFVSKRKSLSLIVKRKGKFIFIEIRLRVICILIMHLL